MRCWLQLLEVCSQDSEHHWSRLSRIVSGNTDRLTRPRDRQAHWLTKTRFLMSSFLVGRRALLIRRICVAILTNGHIKSRRMTMRWLAICLFPARRCGVATEPVRGYPAGFPHSVRVVDNLDACWFISRRKHHARTIRPRISARPQNVTSVSCGIGPWLMFYARSSRLPQPTNAPLSW